MKSNIKHELDARYRAKKATKKAERMDKLWYALGVTALALIFLYFFVHQALFVLNQ